MWWWGEPAAESQHRVVGVIYFADDGQSRCWVIAASPSQTGDLQVDSAPKLIVIRAIDPLHSRDGSRRHYASGVDIDDDIVSVVSQNVNVVGWRAAHKTRIANQCCDDQQQ